MPGMRRAIRAGKARNEIHWFEAKCRQAGLKVTPQRRAVYQMLLETDEHPSAEMVFREVRKILQNISLDTVNRTLLKLSEMGAAFVVEGSGDAKRFDANLETHQHFKCVRCKKIIDFRDSRFDDIPLPRGIGKRFTVLKKTVYFEGLCSKCGRGAS